MEREEVIAQINSTINNMNLFGLEIVLRMINGMDAVEICNVNTNQERVQEIQDQQEKARKEEAERIERAQAEEKVQEDEQFSKREEKRLEYQKSKISSLTGKERIFWNKIEKVRKMSIERYGLQGWQNMLINEIYEGVYFNASYSVFCYGFHQGIQYQKNQTKNKHKSSRKEIDYLLDKADEK